MANAIDKSIGRNLKKTAGSVNEMSSSPQGRANIRQTLRNAKERADNIGKARRSTSDGYMPKGNKLVGALAESKARDKAGKPNKITRVGL